MNNYALHIACFILFGSGALLLPIYEDNQGWAAVRGGQSQLSWAAAAAVMRVWTAATTYTKVALERVRDDGPFCRRSQYTFMIAIVGPGSISLPARPVATFREVKLY